MFNDSNNFVSQNPPTALKDPEASPGDIRVLFPWDSINILNPVITEEELQSKEGLRSPFTGSLDKRTSVCRPRLISMCGQLCLSRDNGFATTSLQGIFWL